MMTRFAHGATQTWRVLIIDDSPDDRAEVRRLLLRGSERRYDLTEAETGAAGLRGVLEAGELPDCVVLDYNMPDMDAVEVLLALAGSNGLTVCPVVVLTGSVGYEFSRAVLQAGAQDYLTKGAVDPSVLSNPGNNVSCILVLPIHMRRGFGRVLIEFSYLLTKVEGRTGSPEKPLSDMGLVSYRSYWRGVLCKLLVEYQEPKAHSRPPSIATIAKETGMTPDDIVSTLEALRFLVRDPITRTYALRLDFDYMKEYVEKQDKKAHIQIQPQKLVWTPYVMGRPTNYFALGEEANAPIQTKAPRENQTQSPYSA